MLMDLVFLAINILPVSVASHHTLVEQHSVPVVYEQAFEGNTASVSAKRTGATFAAPSLVPIQTPKPTPKPTQTSVVLGATDVESLFIKYSDEYKVDRGQLRRIAVCESNLNPNASHLGYAGMYQFSAGSWASVRNEMGLDTNESLRKNAEESIKTAAFILARGRQNVWPSCK